MFNIDPEEEHAKHFAKFQAELRLYNHQLFESTDGVKKKFEDFYSYEIQDEKKYITFKEDAPAEVTNLIKKMVKTFLTPPFH